MDKAQFPSFPAPRIERSFNASVLLERQDVLIARADPLQIRCDVE